MPEGTLGTAERVYFLVFGAILLALTIWNFYVVLTQRDPSARTAAVKSVVAGIPWACAALLFVVQPPPDIFNKLLGPSVCLGLGLLLLLFPESLGPRVAMIKRGLGFFFIGEGVLVFLPWWRWSAWSPRWWRRSEGRGCCQVPRKTCRDCYYPLLGPRRW
jgi:hypothetical protein